MQNSQMLKNELVTERLRLRQWQSKDLAPFVKLNADARVRKHFPSLLSSAESHAAMQVYRRHIATHGWGLWAAEINETKEFIGFIGLQSLAEDMPCAPAVEIGWRLAVSFWGKGYASEGAREVLRFAFDSLGLETVVSLATTTNINSQKVMQRIGMTNAGENFLHPRIPPGHRLAEHVKYQLSRADWQSGQS